MFSSVSIENLPVGARLRSAIYDERRTKLLGAGIEITGPLLESLRRRNVSSVVVSQLDLSRLLAFRPQGKARTVPDHRAPIRVTLENDGSRELDQQVTVGQVMPRLAPSTTPFVRRLKATELRSFDPALTEFLIECREQHVEQAISLAEACVRGDADLKVANDIARESLTTAIEDVDAYACLAVNPQAYPYPMRHAMHTAMVAVAMGITLGFDESRLLELGLGCVLHDTAMLRVDRMVLGAKKVLEPTEFAKIAEHPLRVLELIENQIESVPPGARMVAYQLHERCNGSGYPRGRTLEQTHPLARVAAVADTYAALVTDRPHRPGMLPYFAMEKMIKDVAAGLYDPQVVRALLQTVGLFPLGSYVDIAGGYVGRIIRANHHDYTRPVVELRKASSSQDGFSVVDLAQESEFKVVRPLVNLAA
jgi:HD-GYP domain-containing protein (c-di-GMP phosphodiesterase class II)